MPGMEKENQTRSGWMLWLGAAVAALAVALHRIEYSPLSVIVDARWAAAGAALLGALLSALALRRAAGWRRGLAGLAAIAGVAVILLGARLLFFHHTEEEVKFRNGDAELAGTLYLPRAAGPHPAVVFVHGSGPMTRHEFRMYARWFAENGVASLIYDKRGTGASGGTRASGTYDVLARDAVAGLRYLQQRQEIHHGQIGIFGFSEGEWVGPLAANYFGETAFLILQSASGVSPAQQVQREIETRLQRMGYPAETVKKAVDLNARVFEFQRTGANHQELQAELNRVKAEKWFQDADDIPDDLGRFEEWAWWRAVMDFDPAPVYGQLRCPVLVVIGELNPQYPAQESRKQIQAMLAAGGNPDVTIQIFPEADHAMLQWWLPGRMPPPRFPAGYLELLGDWLRQRVEESR